MIVRALGKSVSQLKMPPPPETYVVLGRKYLVVGKKNSEIKVIVEINKIERSKYSDLMMARGESFTKEGVRIGRCDFVLDQFDYFNLDDVMDEE